MSRNEPNFRLTLKRHRLEQRARILHQIRAFFNTQGFLEVETPQRIPVNAPEAQISPQPCGDWQLQTSPELAMKRLLAADYGPIFQISHCWRQNERGSRHLPEFTLLEWYRPNCDYQQLMSDCEALLRTLLPAEQLQWQKHKIDLRPPFQRLSVDQAFALHTELSADQALREDCFDQLLCERIEPRLGLVQPHFLYDYPSELAALSRRKPDLPHRAERFELYIAGLELANGFSELIDPDEQRQRFEAERKQIEDKYGVRPALPEAFLHEMKHLPPCAGIALGIDRLVMLLTNAIRIEEVVSFTPEEL